MKTVYAAPFTHEARDEALEFEQDQQRVEKLRKEIERDLAQRIAALKPQKVFIEGYARGRDVSADVMKYSDALNRFGLHWDPLKRMLGVLVKDGLRIEGMEHMRVFRFHGFLINTDARVTDLILKTSSRVLLLTEKKAVALMLWAFFELMWRQVLAGCWNLCSKPLEAMCMVLRDFYMGRWISSAAVDGVNVAIYGAAHRPMRFITSNHIERRVVVDLEEVEKRSDDLQKLKWTLTKSELLARAKGLKSESVKKHAIEKISEIDRKITAKTRQDV